MSGTSAIEDRAQKLSGLLEKKLGLKGRSLQRKLRRNDRRLPKWVVAEARKIEEAELHQSHPKLAKRTDSAEVEAAYRKCSNWLSSYDTAARRRAFWMSILTVNAVNLLIIAVALLIALQLLGLV